MARNKNNQFKKNKKAKQQTDAEFAKDDGLEKVALRAQEKSK